jgi:hypothetical protein
MLSVIVYGRNDSHGYNLHKRAAISLNCIAEVLSDDDDEILFADYNTPNDLPTFIEAIYDTLTDKAKSRLRVFRIRPELHARMITERTHLSAVEPHSRNIAIRRSNPRNRWLLFTNTDMIFLPKNGVANLSEAVRDLPDGQYILPRFELPEPLWEALPRSEPETIMRTCERLSRVLHLDEVTVAHDYTLFDSPGDFQLVPRQTMFDIRGFDERMVHGWHVDSNLCKRLYLLYDRRTESLAHRMRGYHCDHTRVATLAHRLDLKLENNLLQFVHGVEDPVGSWPAETWGAPDEAIEELDFVNGVQTRFAGAVERVLGAPQQTEYYSNAHDLRNFVFYQPEHALPYLAANLTTYPRDARFVYLGNHPRMLDLIARCILEMDFTEPLRYVRDLLLSEAGPESAVPIPSGDDSLTSATALIFDFGLDNSGLNLGKIARVTDWPKDLRYSLGAVARCLETCAENADATWKSLNRIPEFIVLNATHHVFREFTKQFLLAADTPYNTRVRKGRPRLGEERLYRSHTWKNTEQCMLSFFGYGVEDDSLAAIEAGHAIDLTSSAQSARYKDGAWGLEEMDGTWTDGFRSSIVFSPPPSLTNDLLVRVMVTEAFIGPDSQPIRVQVLLEDEFLARWEVASRHGPTSLNALLPARLMAGKQRCRLTFHVENPQSAHQYAVFLGQQVIGEDPRELGIKIQQITFAEADLRPCVLGTQIDFTEAVSHAFYVGDGWTHPDDLGLWTVGSYASLSLRLTEAVETSVVASFLITDAVVNHEYPHLKVEVRFNGKPVTEWRLGPNRSGDMHKVLIPVDILRGQDRLCISFHIDEPRTPVQLKWSDTDMRSLGFRLTKFCLNAVPTYNLGQVIDLTAASGSALDHLSSKWSLPDPYGVWTSGPDAAITMRFKPPPVTGFAASFVISDCMLAKSAPELLVLVKANGTVVAEWRLRDRRPHRRSIHLPAGVISASRELMLAFEIPMPRSPASLGWSDDPRPLGIRLARVLLGDGELEIPEVEPARFSLRAKSVWSRFWRLKDSMLHRIRTAPKGAL